ncbi:LytR/AlgR family response regulator transcription factor [Chitinophaga nivalis]|uniref:LytTR family DNA-binding domain-containing protein n=1 Tax=Chitinophaga nivalis TaxID=2991709 RepID=A0ABT3IJJ6_9BACT|nr:LytTR family DNA-binding domain-containing protein [Chitinophaga nivalis]MCW3466173.1 LytTR family DNA-binding domain-containing protein [Chitinophaga nivalis]MCW3484136.1 LytTR family DNA-binding domain-containing protein [Chitinophaga nivalis]
MYKAIIVEDEYHLREALSILIEMVAPETIQLIGYAERAAEAVKLIDRLKPDLVFMDIMLKEGTGFDVLQQVNHRTFHLIFTTAYEEHAVRAFKFSAIDYLLKPIDAAELKMALDRITTLQERLLADKQLTALNNNLDKTPKRLVLPTQEAMHVVKIDQILRCETSGSYTTFYFTDGKKIIVSRPLKTYEDILLPPDFFRVHQSHLININYIVSYSREGLVQMEDNTTIPISRGNKEAFFKLMKDG